MNTVCSTKPKEVLVLQAESGESDLLFWQNSATWMLLTGPTNFGFDIRFDRDLSGFQAVFVTFGLRVSRLCNYCPLRGNCCGAGNAIM